ncbi:N-formimino-L-glutamate deiminase [compost metagenome]
MQGRQLLRMELDRQTQLQRGLEHPFNLRRRERKVLAERIHGIHQAFGCQHRQHAPRDLVDVIIGAPREFRRQGMRGQAGRAHGQGQGVAQPPRHPEHLALVGQVQPIAGLDLQRGHAVAQQMQRPPAGAGVELVLGGASGCAHGAGDAAALRRDARIVHALQPLFEFLAAIAAKHQVRVAIDQPGRDPGAAQIIDLCHLHGRQRRLRAYPFDAVAARHDGRALDCGIFAARHRRGMTVAPEDGHHRLGNKPAGIRRLSACAAIRPLASAMSGAKNRSFS